jgi:hypothetical protein
MKLGDGNVQPQQITNIYPFLPVRLEAGQQDGTKATGVQVKWQRRANTNANRRLKPGTQDPGSAKPQDVHESSTPGSFDGALSAAVDAVGSNHWCWEARSKHEIRRHQFAATTVSEQV